MRLLKNTKLKFTLIHITFPAGYGFIFEAKSHLKESEPNLIIYLWVMCDKKIKPEVIRSKSFVFIVMKKFFGVEINLQPKVTLKTKIKSYVRDEYF